MAELARVLRHVRERIDFLKARPGSDPTINRELEGLGIDLNVLQAAAGILRKYERQPHPRRGHISEESNIGLTITILRDAGGPLHVTEILGRLKLYAGRDVKRGVLTSRLAKLARERRIFMQVAPARYDLLDRSIVTHSDQDHTEGLAALRRTREEIQGKKPT